MRPDPVREFESHREQLWVAPDPLRWVDLPGGCEASVPVAGGPDEAEARVVLKIGRRSSAAGSVMLFWRGARVVNIDLSGGAHPDAVTGRRVPTPHYQWIDDLGRERAVFIDMADEGIGGLRDAFYWFLTRCNVVGRPAWRDPPLQGHLPGSPRPQRKRGRQA